MKKLEIGAVYRHYKGNNYEVVGLALHSETLEELVAYRALYNHNKYGKNSLWVRPKKMFLENVTVGGKKVERFKKIKQKILIKPSKK
jgi:hypothetical protein